MNQSVCILGRQPSLGMAELESLLGPDVLHPIAHGAVLVDVDARDIPMQRLGGTVKIAKLLTTLPYTDWDKIAAYLEETLLQHLQYFPEGKIRLGLSVHGLPVSVKRINTTGLSLKKVIKNAGRSVRVVPNSAPDLNSAQILHNQLTGPTGLEVVIVRDGNRTVLAQTIAVQDIEAYAARDQNRPKRDARVGMLPPKLAQIIINLAGSHVKPYEPKTALPGKSQLARVLDPFCGTGVLLQEGLLMGYDVYGTDLEPRMIEYSQVNLEWLKEKYTTAGNFTLEVGDATHHSWQPPVDIIACETYLGRPFTGIPRPSVLEEVVRDVDTIHRKFLKNVAKQTESGFRMTIAVPAWKLQKGFKHLPILDSLEELGYTRASFVHADTRELIYHRPDQIVARELVTLIRK
ncbi:MAG: hypothetical protein JWL85_302 [Candidatus Saccharibacteria bacterium]|nr:hypothetical protein [Candidatus Saccharibacteria bacterium]